MENLGASCGKFESKLWKFWEQLVEIAYAAGEKIEYNKLSFTFVRRKKRFQSTIKWIFPYKMSAAGEIFYGFRALLRRFYLTKRAPQAKNLRFQSATKGILPYKMSAAGENFVI